MDSLKRLERIRSHGNHLFYMAMALLAGYLIALMAYTLILLLLKSM